MKILILAIAAVFGSARASFGQPFAYVSSGQGVTVVNQKTNTVTASIPLSGLPGGLALTPDGTNLFVTLQSQNKVAIVSTASNTTTATVATGNTPIAIAISPNGTLAYVANQTSNTITVIDIASKSVVSTVGVGSSPTAVAFTPDGTRVLVANSSSSTISVINVTSNIVVGTWKTFAGPTGIAVSLDGSTAYVANAYGHAVTIHNTSSGSILTALSNLPFPNSATVSPDGSQVYITEGNGQCVSIISTSSHAVVATVTVGADPTSIAVSGNGSMAYVTNRTGHSVSVFNTATYSVTATLTNTGANPSVVVGGYSTPSVAIPTPPASTGLPPLPSSLMVPTLPQASVTTTYPTITGTSWPVHAGGNLQTALNSANCGDEIVLDAGATFNGNYNVPLKFCAGQSILVRSSAAASLTSGVRVQQSQAPLMPTVATPNSQSVLGFAGGTAGWYFAGINFTVANGVKGLWNLITLSVNATSPSQLPQDIVFDRVLVHGNDQQCIRGFLADAISFGLIYSQVYNFVAAGQDAQALIAYNSPGPFLLFNNYLEGGAENIMFGGGTTTIANVVPSDITIRMNYLAKQPSWYKNPAPCGGSGQSLCYDLKDNFEIKNGRRILFDSNVMTYSYAQGQGECMIINTPQPWGLTAQDITVTNNLCLHAPKFFAFSGNSTTISARLLVRNNLATDINPNIYGYNGQITGTVEGPDSNWIIDHNTVVGIPWAGNLGTAGIFFGDNPPSTNSAFQFTNNLMYQSLGADSDNPYMALTNFPIGTVLTNDVFVSDTWPQGCVGCIPAGPAYPAEDYLYSATSTATPAGNAAPCNYPAGLSMACVSLNWGLVQFQDYTDGSTGASLAGLTLSINSPYHNAGSDGADIGANVGAILAATVGVVQ